MRQRQLFAALGTLCALVLAAPLVPASAAGTSHVKCTLADDRLTESSGVAKSIRFPHVLWTHNDSGDSARVFAISSRTCKTIATYTLTGVSAVDWEDMAVARDRRGTPSIYVADIGDNAGTRTEIAIYRIKEPNVTRGDHAVAHHATWRLRYPDGHGHDAEALLVARGGWKSIATKSASGVTVYRVPSRPDANAVQTLLHPVSRTDITVVDGGSVSAGGRHLVLRNYQNAYVWRVGSGPARKRIQRAIGGHAHVVALPAQQQGEAVAAGARRMVVTSEGAHTPVYSVPLPDLSGG